MRKIIAFAIATIVCNLSGVGAHAQDWQPKRILFHVTSVQRTEDTVACTAGSCTTTKYTVEGYADLHRAATKTQYKITCNEILYDLPRPHRENICARFHAGNAYVAQLRSDQISFPHSMLNKDFETDYSIVAEKEIPKGPEDRDMPSASEPREATNGPEQHNPAPGPEQLASKGMH